MKVNKIYKITVSVLLSVLMLLLSLSITSVFVRAESQYFSGEGTQASPYIISTKDDLITFANLINSGDGDYLGKYYLLNSNIDITSVSNWTPIGGSYSFNGTFDGGGHVIIGMNINVTVSSGNIGYIGLFGKCSGTIKNLGITQSKITAVCNSSTYTGGLVGYATNANLINCYSTADISATGNALTYSGGICGYSLSSNVLYCYNIGNIYGKEAGGLIGNSTDGTINRCYNAGNITASNYAGGLVGSGYANFNDCYNYGDIGSTSDTNYAGGIIGQSDANCLIQNCANTGEVKSSESCGAIIGWDTSSCNLVSCYYLDNNSKAVGSPALTGNTRTLAQMQEASTYSGYDFESVWIMPSYSSFPYLRSSLVHPSSVTIKGDETTVQTGQNIKLSASVLPQNATDKGVIWSSDNEDKASVDNNGCVTGLSKGTAVIRAKTKDGGYEDIFSVTVTDIKVTFDTKGGSAIDDFYCAYGLKVTKPADPAKDGCTFCGWYKENTYDTLWDFDNDIVTVPTTIYAKWSANTYNVLYNSRGGSEVNASTAVYDTLLNAPSVPAKTGYTFVAWYKDESLSQEWKFSSDKMPSNDIILYAKWGAELCTVNFDTDGGSEINSVSAYYDDTVMRPSDPVKTGHTFAGWYKDENLVNEWDFDSDKIYNSSITIYAKYSVNTYTVHFISSGGSVVDDITEAYYDSIIDKPSDPTMTEHAFLGWYKDEALTQAWNFDEDKIPDGDVTLWAKWKINSYTVTFNSSGGSDVSSIIADYNTCAAEPLAPVKSASIFAGWYKNASFIEPWIFDADKVTVNTTLYAKWVDRMCTVSFWSIGGTSVSNMSVVIDSKITQPAQPVKTGYIFIGWFKDYMLIDKWDFSSDIVKSNMSLYAGWIKEAYADYNLNDYLQIQRYLNLPSSVADISNGQCLSWLYDQSDPSTWPGITWSDGDDKRAIIIDWESCGLAGDLDLSGCDALVSVDCSANALQSVDISGCASIASLNCANNLITDLNTSNCGSLTSLNCGNNNLSELNISQNTALADLYCNNNVITALNINNNTALVNANLSQNKLKYINLSLNNSLVSINLSDNMLTHIKLIVSSSVKDTYSYGNGYIYLNSDAYSADSYIYSHPYGGSSLYHWIDGTADKGNADSFLLSNIESACLTAQFNPVTVKFVTNSESAINDAIVNYDNTVSRPIDPVKEGSELLGWYKDYAFSQIWDFDNDKVSENITLYAKWSKNNVTFETNGANSVDNISGVVFGEKISAPVNVTKKYYTLNGWKYLDEDSVWQIWNFDTDTVCRDIKLYADWSYTSCAISAEANNASYGTVTGSGLYEANSTVMLKAAPNAGYGFVCWMNGDKEVSADYIYIFSATGSRSLTAKFAPLTAPLITKLTADYSSITLNWNSAEGANGYEIYRAASSAGVYSKIYTTDSLSYTDTPLAIGKYYYYKIRAVCDAGNTVTYGPYCSVKYAKTTLLTPAVTAASYNYNSVKVSWNAVNGATGYKVYRATSSKGRYSLIATTKYTYYKNTSLTTGRYYYYKVIAYRTNGRTTTYSAYSSIKYAKPIPSTPTTSSAASYSYNSIKVSWGAVSGASGYELYYSTSQNGTYKLLKATTGKYYVHGSLVTGKNYYYKVRAYRTVYRKKIYSAFATVTFTMPIPSKPLPVADNASYTSNIINWSAVSGASGYEIYQTNEAGTDEDLLSDTGALRTYTHTSLITNQIYYYKIKAYRTMSGVKVYGSFSASVSSTPVPTSPANLKVTLNSYNSLNVSWNVVDGATGYEISRSLYSTSGFVPINTADSTSYIDNDLTTGKTYYYKVRAIIDGNPVVYGDYSTVSGLKVIPATPIVTVSTASYNSLSISWDEVAGATGYRIYRATSSKGTYALIKTISDGSTSYVNTGLATGSYYYYKVLAYRTEGAVTTYSAYSTIKYAKVVPAAPEGANALSASSNSITITWNTVPGASGYTVYRLAANETYPSIATVSGLNTVSYTNTNLAAGTTYYYKVAAYRLVGTTKVYGGYSEIVSAKPADSL